jgi:hypothetical protein
LVVEDSKQSVPKNEGFVQLKGTNSCVGRSNEIVQEKGIVKS